MLIDELAGGAIDTGYARVGLLAVAVDDDETARFGKFRDVVMGRQAASGHPTGHELREVTADEAHVDRLGRECPLDDGGELDRERRSGRQRHARLRPCR